MAEQGLEVLPFSSIVAQITSDLEVLEKARKEAGGEADLEAVRSNVEKLLVALPQALALEDDLNNDHYKLVIDLVHSVLGQGIDVEHADFFVVAHIIRLFTVCLSEFEEAAKADVPAVVDYTFKLIQSLVALPTFGKRTGEEKEPKEEDEDDEDEFDSEDESLFGTNKKLTKEEYHLFAFSLATRLYHSLLSDPDNRPQFSDIGNPLLHSLCAVLPTVEFHQLKVDCAELLSQIGLLCLTPAQVKDWEELEVHEQIMEDFLNEEGGEGSEILDAVGDFDEYAKFPFFKSTLDAETVGQTITLLMNLNGNSDIFAGQPISEEESVPLSAIVAVLCGIATNSFDNEVTTKIITDAINIVVEQLKETNQEETCLPKIPLINTLGHVFALSPQSAIEGNFPHFLALFESIAQKEHQKIQPKPSKGGRGGRGGRGRGGRGRGGGGGGAGQVDPEKEMMYKLLQRVLAKSLAVLVGKGGVKLLDSANKFLTSVGPSFKYRDLMFHFIIAVKRVLATEEGKAHPLFQATSDLVDQKTNGQFQFVVDSVKAKFGTLPKKLEGIRCITKFAAATTAYNNGTPLFPDYLVKSVDILVDALNNDFEGVGVAIFASFETLLKTYSTSEIIGNKVEAILKACLKVLSAKADKEEKSQLYSGLHLSALDIVQVIFKTPELAPKAKQFSKDLASLLKGTLQVAMTKVEENYKEMMAEQAASIESAQGGAWEGARVEEVTSEEEKKTAAAAPAADATPATPASADAPAGAAFPKFDFTGGAGAATTGAAGGFAFPKFDFGGAGAGAAAGGDAPNLAFPTFDWNALAKTAEIESASDDEDSDDFGRGRGRGARGGRGRGAGGRGRGRGRGRMVESDDFFSDSDDVDHDWDDGDSDDEDMEGEEGDEMEEQASICVSALDTLIAIAKVAEGEDKASLKELVQEGIQTCDTLKKMTDLGDIVSRRKRNLEALEF